MSSPLSMLKKTRRTPLQDSLMDEQGANRKVPFKRNLLQEIKATLVADDPLSPSPPQSHAATNVASTSKSGARLKQGAPSDFELMAAMMHRITMLENMLRSQALEMHKKDEMISVLEEQLRPQEESDSEGTPCLSSRYELKKRCQVLQNKVQEMENFLGDYGLIWVGDEDSSNSEDSPQNTNPGLSPDGGFHMNFDLVLLRIRELNVLAGEGESFVQATGTGAKLAKRDPIQLRLYRNGIVMFDGPFRSYQEHSTQQCMQDLMDGYFPSELQQRFPDGVPFEVHDRRDDEFMVRTPWHTFPGDGQAVCGKESTDSVGFVPDRRLTTDQFLNKLPKVVVKAGNVITIRGSLRKTLQGLSDAQSSSSSSSSSSEILIDTPALRAMTERTQKIDSDKPAQAAVTLKLKSEDGNLTYVMKMSLSETVGQLRAYLDKHRGAGQPGYDIISAYPRCSFGDDNGTLESCGLSGNVTLRLRQRHQ
ncbi:PREDICTED: UBX domain-containing protein 11 [Poecilia mexicana]|uniref:UBX domain-containing protein 11 n=1 Tax=Poecilia mexicana TaxID=48701 RepID=UPI00072E80D2|nr:PREDICTED: UBX domain-containing protein 11 [Poecilia mexicana]XP_014866004.1 PREDICTED: UBX domain-containing protein 11 [Poecilia mexicana]